MDAEEVTRGWNAYFDWAAELAGINETRVKSGADRLSLQGVMIDDDDSADDKRGDKSKPSFSLWEPVFVRSEQKMETREFFDVLEKGLDVGKKGYDSKSDPREKGFAFDQSERQFNTRFRQDNEPVEAVIYRKRGQSDDALDAVADIVAVGGLIAFDGTSRAPLRTNGTGQPPAKVALGVIDDGLPIYHENLRNGPNDTRIEAFWAQSFSASAGGGGLGAFKTRTDIQTQLARLGLTTEDDLYAQDAAQIYQRTTKHSLRHQATHGSIIFDAMAGLAPDMLARGDGGDAAKAMAEIPLFGVQLPPQAFDDTSGMRLQLPFLQALRWLMLQVSLSGAAKSLVINASLGITAGPKDGTSLIEQLIARELKRVNEHPEFALPTKLVLPYGNAYADNLIAEYKVKDRAKVSTALILPPDDKTPSYLELRSLPGGAQDLAKLRVSLTSPGGHITLAPRSLQPGRHVTLRGPDGRPVARVYHVPARFIWSAEEPAYLAVAFAPTTQIAPGDLVSPYGRWGISVENCAGAGVRLSVQVQRDDSPFARTTGARQAYLDGPNAHGWNSVNRNHDLVENGAITYAGTNSAYTGLTTGPFDKSVDTVGAVRILPDGASAPARYTAQGAGWSGTAPDVSCVVEPNAASEGLRAAGMSSGGTARAGGTSVASARYARHLALSAMGVALPQTVAPAPQARLGKAVIP